MPWRGWKRYEWEWKCSWQRKVVVKCIRICLNGRKPPLLNIFLVFLRQLGGAITIIIGPKTIGKLAAKHRNRAITSQLRLKTGDGAREREKKNFAFYSQRRHVHIHYSYCMRKEKKAMSFYWYLFIILELIIWARDCVCVEFCVFGVSMLRRIVRRTVDLYAMLMNLVVTMPSERRLCKRTTRIVYHIFANKVYAIENRCSALTFSYARRANVVRQAARWHCQLCAISHSNQNIIIRFYERRAKGGKNRFRCLH